MMRHFLAVVIILILYSASSQTNVLTGIRNGNWSLLDTNGRILTTTEYHYIHTFDQRNTSYFLQNGLYGILDGTGKQKSAAQYIDIVQHGFGIYSVQKEERWQLLNVTESSNDVIIDTLIQLPDVISENWILLNDSLQSKLINLESGKEIVKPFSSSVITNSTDYLVVLNDSLITAYTPKGDALLSVIGNCFKYNQNIISIYDTLGNYSIINEEGLVKFPFNVTAVNFGYGSYFAGSNNMGFLIDSRTQEIIFKGPYSYIYDYDDHYYYVRGKSGINLINKRTKKELLPTGLSSFYKTDSMFIVYKENQTMGYCDLNGKLFLGYYDGINKMGSLFQVSINQNLGLYSLRRKQFVLPAIYYSITSLGKNRYKASTNDVFTVIETNNSHEITKRIDGSNNVVIRTASSKNGKFRYDPRLLLLGWYIDSSEVEVQGEMQKQYRWGLKDELDSTVLRPKYKELNYIEGPFSLNVLPKRLVEMRNGSKVNTHLYEFISWENGKKISGLECLYVDSNDFEHKEWTKFSTPKRQGIVSSEGKIRYLTFISSVEFPFTRYCDAENIDRSTNVTDTSFTLSQHDFRWNPTVVKGNAIVALKGKWNFLKPDGSDLFKEPFQFANDFVGSTAIVKRNNKWGVINQDTILIPFEFTKIERKIIGSDTLFLTESSPQDSRYLDEQLNTITGLKTAVMKTDSLILATLNGKQCLLNFSREIVQENVKSVKVLPSGYLKARIEKETQILDKSGNTVLTTETEVVDVLADRYCLIEKSNRFGLLDFSETTVLEEIYSSIEEHGGWIVAKSDKYYLYNTQMELIATSANAILIDPVSKNYGIVKKNTVTIYQGKLKVAKLKNCTPESYWNNLLWTTTKEKSYGITLQGDTIIKSDQIETFEILANELVALRAESGYWQLFTPEWKTVPTPIPFRKFQFIGESYIALVNKKGKYLIWNMETGKTTEVDEVIGSFENDLCLVKKNKKCYYINRELAEVNRLKYSQASPFHHDFAAVIDSRGGTLINPNFKPLTYPSYQGLTYFGANIYKAAPQKLHGIYRVDGTSVLPKHMEKIYFTTRTIIQVVDHGEIFYYRMTGEKMF